MSQPQDPRPGSPDAAPDAAPDAQPRQGDPPGPRRALTEALIIFAVSAVLTRVLSDLAGVSALVAEYLFTLVAGVFLLIPYALLTRTGRSFEAHALTWEGWPRAVGLALLLTLLTALPFFGGYHLWRTQVLGDTFEFSTDNYRQLPVALEGRPALLEPTDGPAVQLWREGQRVWLAWSAGPGRHRLEVDLQSPQGTILLEQGRSLATDDTVRRNGQPSPQVVLATTTTRPARHQAALRLRDADALRVIVRLDGRVSTETLLRLGPQGATPDQAGALEGGAAVLPRGLGWLPLIILAQLILVALPEEYFYRGYLQTTLGRVWPQRLRIGPLHIGPAIIVTSALFGLGHFIIDLRPARLAVFFPSLLFGWLRDRTGTIAACIVYHACCNLLVEAATHHYG